MNARPGRAAGRAAGVAAKLSVGARTEAAILRAVAELTQPRGPSSSEIARVVKRTRKGVRIYLDRMIVAGLVHETNRGGSNISVTLTPLGYAQLQQTKGTT